MSPYDRAVVYAGLDERATALDWLERAAEHRMLSIVEIGIDPRFAGLSADPRFDALVRRIGIPGGKA